MSEAAAPSRRDFEAKIVARDYAAIGPVANLASRLGTHAAPGQILIGQRLYSAVEEAVEAASVGNLELKGIARPVPAYDVRALRG